MRKFNTLKSCFFSGIFVFTLLTFGFSSSIPADEKPSLFLLKTFDKSQTENITGWLMSEKLDGVRAYWDGKKLYSRAGHVFSAPAWFIKDFPSFPLDGELWTKRNDFESVVSIVRKQQPHNGWKKITYQIFEVPNAIGTLPERLAKITHYLQQHPLPLPHLKVIEQIRCEGESHLDKFTQQIESLGGEGVVIRNPLVNYYAGRSADALKVKKNQDAECRVTGYKPGKGKYKGKIGALYCQTKNHQKLTIGSGLSDKDREFPPAIGTLITFKYYGLTANNKPRFPVFLRPRLIYH